MTQIITRRTIERRRRGLFGWVFLLAFWGVNGLMALATIGTVINNERLSKTMTEVGNRSGGSDGPLSIEMMVLIWLVGALVTGLLALMTRGPKEVIEYETKEIKTSRG